MKNINSAVIRQIETICGIMSIKFTLLLNPRWGFRNCDNKMLMWFLFSY